MKNTLRLMALPICLVLAGASASVAQEGGEPACPVVLFQTDVTSSAELLPLLQGSPVAASNSVCGSCSPGCSGLAEGAACTKPRGGAGICISTGMVCPDGIGHCICFSPPAG